MKAPMIVSSSKKYSMDRRNLIMECLAVYFYQSGHKPVFADVVFVYHVWSWWCSVEWCFNSLRPRQNGRNFQDDIFKCLFLNENVWIPIKISLKFVPKGPSNKILALVQIMAWRRPGDKPLSEPILVSLPTHICVTRPQWVKASFYSSSATWQLPPLHIEALVTYISSGLRWYDPGSISIWTIWTSYLLWICVGFIFTKLPLQTVLLAVDPGLSGLCFFAIWTKQRVFVR